MVQSSSPKRVLIVEDNRAFRLGMQSTLNYLNCQVDTAENGEQALEKVNLYPYDLIFIDIELPDINGLEVTRQIRALPDIHASHIPIVVVTGHSELHTRKNYETMGIQKLVTKPISVSMLTSLLQQFS